MSKIADVKPVTSYERYAYSKNISFKSVNIESFFVILGFRELNSGRSKEYYAFIKRQFVLNTPETADELSILLNPDLLKEKYISTVPLDLGPEVIMDVGDYRMFIRVPDYAEIGWLILDGVLIDPNEYKNWMADLMEKGLPPRSQEEIEQERLKKIEDERIANLRPVKNGKVAVVRLYDTINYNVVVLTLDLNNTTVKQLRQAIAGALGAPPAGVPMASTNAFTIDQILDRVKSRGINSAVNFDSNNRFRSVLTGRKHGQNPPVGVDPSQRSTISDGQRLADIKGNVIVYAHVHNFPKETFLSKLKEIGVEAAIDILIG